MVDAPPSTRRVGRYLLHDPIAAGGMATVHFGRLVGPVGFTRTVAIKRLHPQFAADPEFVAMFIDEARLAARIRHPNVVQTLDVVSSGSEVLLVLDYVQGEPLSRLRRYASEAKKPIPLRVAASIMCGVLHGLHAAHEAKSDHGSPLDIVHRDVSPQNILVGADGIPRVLDFGVAKALGRSHTTRDGNLKGKLTYMAPEQLEGKVTRRSDIFAATIVLWETLTDRRLFAGQDDVEVVGQILEKPIEPPSKFLGERSLGSVGKAEIERLDAVTMRGLARRPDDRFATAREMALALEACLGVASPAEVGLWVEGTAGSVLDARAQRVAEIESKTSARGPQSVPQPSVRLGEVPTVVDSRPPAGDQVTQASSVSLSSHTPVRRSPSWTGTTLLSILVALGVSLGFATIWNRAGSGRSASQATSLPPTSAQAPASGAGAAPASPPTNPVPLASETPAAAARAESSAPASTSSPAPAAAPAPRASASGAGRKPSRPSAPKVDCSVPYTIDSAGRQHFKEECFH